MPDDALGVAVRLLAFALVISAAALTPAPGAGGAGQSRPDASAKSSAAGM